MIQRSISLERRLVSETLRAAGGLARLVFYDGVMPLRCELMADGQRLDNLPAHEQLVRDLAGGKITVVPPDKATYWRLIDNNGNVVMQGKSDGGG